MTRNSDSNRDVLLKQLAQVVTDLDRLVAFTRPLCSKSRERSRIDGSNDSDPWDLVRLDSVLNNGLKILDDDELKWLSNNPVALFVLHSEICEQLPPIWMTHLVVSGKEARNRVYSDSSEPENSLSKGPLSQPENDFQSAKTEGIETGYTGLPDEDSFMSDEDLLDLLLTNREMLVAHARGLKASNQTSDEARPLSETELDQVMRSGLKELTKEAMRKLLNNPVALFQVFDEIHTALPDAWLAKLAAAGRAHLAKKGKAGS